MWKRAGILAFALVLAMPPAAAQVGTDTSKEEARELITMLRTGHYEWGRFGSRTQSRITERSEDAKEMMAKWGALEDVGPPYYDESQRTTVFPVRFENAMAAIMVRKIELTRSLQSRISALRWRELYRRR